MITKDRLRNLILFISAVIIGIAMVNIFYIFSQKTNTVVEDVYGPKIKELQLSNEKLSKQIFEEKKNSTIYLAKIDSLTALKGKVEIKYIKIYEKIDNSNSDNLVDEYSRIFANEGINQ